MESYFNIILDTTAPSGVTAVINGEEAYTSSTAATLAIGCSDTDTTGYQMKIWGISGAATEADAVWETYAESKNITLSVGDGLKTVYVKVRDDVWNESEAASDTITLCSEPPVVTIAGPSVAKISEIDAKNATTFSFTCDKAVSAFKVSVVESVNAECSDVTNKTIPAAGGSQVYIINPTPYQCSSEGNMDSDDFLSSSSINAGVVFYATLYGADLNAASPGDGAKIIKVFVRDADSGLWSL